MVFITDGLRVYRLNPTDDNLNENHHSATLYFNSRSHDKWLIQGTRHHKDNQLAMVWSTDDSYSFILIGMRCALNKGVSKIVRMCSAEFTVIIPVASVYVFNDMRSYSALGNLDRPPTCNARDAETTGMCCKMNGV